MPPADLLAAASSPIFVRLSYSLEAAMTELVLRRIGLGVLCLLGLQVSVQAAELGASGPIRMESVTIGERSTEIFVRFDRPISHERSSLLLLLNGKTVETIHPRLEAAPNVLFARIVTPARGNYVLRWTICPQGSNDRYDGEFPFTIGHVTPHEGGDSQPNSHAE
jgi:hypothetical protein